MTNQPVKGPYRVEEYVGDNGGPVTDIVDAEGHRIAECFDLPTAQLLADSWAMLELLRRFREISLGAGLGDPTLTIDIIKLDEAAEALLAKYKVEK